MGSNVPAGVVGSGPEPLGDHEPTFDAGDRRGHGALPRPLPALGQRPWSIAGMVLPMIFMSNQTDQPSM